MKKVITIIIIIVLTLACFPPVGFAKTISEMTFKELIYLRQKINLELFSRDEWQEVTVPHGVYFVGRDIPAGTWTVKCGSAYINDRFSASYCEIEWGEYLDENGHGISGKGYRDYVQISNPESKYYEGEMTEYSFTVKYGDYIIVGDSGNSAVFLTYIGAPDLGFK